MAAAMTKKAVLLALGAMAALAFTATHTQAGILSVSCPKQCGSEADKMECPENQCCNKDGSCGFGADYCSAEAGCQSGACFENQKCLRQLNGTVLTATCPSNQCCSYNGYCGLGREYCGKGCQAGPCITDHSCAAGKPCANNLCCRGKDWTCGLGEGYCSLIPMYDCQSGPCYYKKCQTSADCGSGYCCNKGYCGLGKAYCGGGKSSIPLLDGLVPVVCLLPST